ncbi:protease [Colwellia psychrerythraea]|mgnify:FL=1|uniref:Protease n=1 Tax=Colwellia psychrerythraea TaxID=28229 RepID=A0A1Y5EM24_COLPS|nr:protease [Colwellia psychrerythraea]
MNFFKRKTTQPSSGCLGKGDNSNKINFSLSIKNTWLLWLCQCLNIAVIALELSTWMLAIISLSLVWQALLLHQNRDRVKAKKPIKTGIQLNHRQNTHLNKQRVTNVAPILLGIFALLGCLAIAITAKEVGILTSMLHLLCFSYVLKAFELKARSDFYQLFLLGLFVLASSLIFRQDLAFTLITFTLLVINLAVLLQLFSLEKAFATNIKVVVILLGQSILLAIVLFLVFPRLSPFWQVPLAKSAETGLPDTVKPGDIANLTRSTKLAFRADFGQQKAPAYSQLYWRAMVLEDYDGRQWSKQKAARTTPSNTVAGADKSSNDKSLTFDASTTDVLPLNYQVIVEPSFQKYLFALAPAVVAGDKSGIKAQTGYTFSSTSVISQAKSYQLASYLTAPLALELSQKSKQVNLRFPEGSNPRLEQFALQLQHNYADVQARAQAVLTFINKEKYAYTLQPQLLDNNSLDQFFFDTQSGFCVHYASAFTFLMRASGVPARMVTGYLGGEYNGDDAQQFNSKGHLSIYQYDAHAWSEIWVAGKGWLRIDPTSAVDPQRVNSGWSSELLQQQSALNNDLISLYQLKNSALLNALRLQFDALDYQWTRWVIGFTTKQQYNLFKNLFGKMASWKLALVIGVSLIISMATFMLFLHLLNRAKHTQQVLSKWQVVYQKALAQLAKQGMGKPAGMTVNDFAKQVREQYPELAIAFTRLSASYNSLCYQTLSINEQDKLALTMQHHYRQFLHILKKQS